MRSYDRPAVTLIPLSAVHTVELSGDDHWYDDQLPEDDETELM